MRSFIYFIESVFYNFIFRFLLWKRPKYDKKYRISICGIFKNESSFLKEWMEYHIMIGIDHFYMYNNNSEDDYLSVLQPYIDNGYVTLIQWTKEHAQMEAYKHFFEHYGQETQWMTFLDIDEFFVPRYKDDINDWIQDYEKYPVILVYWKMFGTSGLVKHNYDMLTIEQYVVSHDGFFTHKGKCIVNMDYPIAFYNEMTHHNTNIRYRLFGFNLRVGPVNMFKRFVIGPYSLSWLGETKPTIQINHYWSKAWDIYDEKRNRTDVFFDKNPKLNMDYFYGFENKNITCDYSIFRFIMKLKMRMHDIK